MADREGDFYDLLKRAHQLDYPADLLLRAQHNRAVGDDLKLWEAIEQQNELTKITFTKPRKRGKRARQVIQAIKVQRYTLRPKGKDPMALTLVQAKEVNPPAGQSPLTWRLITNRQVTTAARAIELIDWYRARWEIWRIMFLMRLGRTCPELPADLVFDPMEWKLSFLLGKKALPEGMPPLNQVIRNLAMLGGFLGRKGDSEPGAKSIWRGYSRVLDGIYTMQIASDLLDG